MFDHVISGTYASTDFSRENKKNIVLSPLIGTFITKRFCIKKIINPPFLRLYTLRHLWGEMTLPLSLSVESIQT